MNIISKNRALFFPFLLGTLLIFLIIIDRSFKKISTSSHNKNPLISFLGHSPNAWLFSQVHCTLSIMIFVVVWNRYASPSISLVLGYIEDFYFNLQIYYILINIFWTFFKEIMFLLIQHNNCSQYLFITGRPTAKCFRRMSYNFWRVIWVEYSCSRSFSKRGNLFKWIQYLVRGKARV